MGVIFGLFAASKGFHAADSFDRANGNIAVGQPNWTGIGSNLPNIVSNQLQLGHVGGSIDVVGNWNPSPTTLKKIFSQLTYVSQAGGAASVVGPVVCLGGTNLATRSWYMAAAGNNGSGNDRMWILKRNPAGGSGVLAGPTAVSSRVPGPARITAIITPTDVTITYTQNGIVVLTAVDNTATRLTSGKFGVAVDSGDGVRQQVFDSWVAGSLAPGGSAFVNIPVGGRGRL